MEVSIHICIRFVSLCSGSFGPERCNGFRLDDSPRCGLNANSSSHEELFYLSAFVIVVYHFNQRRWVETGPPKRTDELRVAHERTRASCYRIVVGCELNGTRLSGSRAADRDCELVDRERELAVMRTKAEVV
ncbi:hypothetical protein F2Q69_00016418 [Brassica cretica]|uniref:Uncharacterized protein n=1 Tax=Brassica cretica TaxID=69181 RepID=A0A8S9QUH8_BRACR|nr:hypothetical protein F2Q69_00016418 [Brassica cretica]